MSTTHTTGPEKPPLNRNERFVRAGAAVGRGVNAGRSFWQRVTEGLELHDLWTQFQSEARASYGLISQDVDWKALEHESGWRRYWRTAQAFFWALFTKLTPARRVLFLAALVLTMFGSLQFRTEKFSTQLNLGGVGVLALIFVLVLELTDRVTMKRDLEIAREIQRWLVPARPPEVPGADIAFATRPANTVAGDYYDVFFRAPGAAAPDEKRLLLVVADVAGKSVPAALLMATFQASLQTLSAARTSLEELVAGLNRYACAHSLGGLRFTTAFIAELDPATRSLSYICAGHNAPVLRRVTGSIERLDAGGLPLGIESATPYESGCAQLARGDLLVIFTDGLIEAINEKDEEYGEARLLEILDTVPGESAAETQRFIMQSVDAFVGATRQHDDITCLILRAI
ncbi:MAG: PP2C family protein-serine/threonine phosphatase [Acidobacteria bacterium]|nr:PP2C family protein-serine/threonine phosphatase [Acidobacteriota bacterium]MBI3661955.1 PP2C family protein-serine/threonine phosphatase [Acidobacteriota bacterium]